MPLTALTAAFLSSRPQSPDHHHQQQHGKKIVTVDTNCCPESPIKNATSTTTTRRPWWALTTPLRLSTLEDDKDGQRSRTSSTSSEDTASTVDSMVSNSPLQSPQATVATEASTPDSIALFDDEDEEVEAEGEEVEEEQQQVEVESPSTPTPQLLPPRPRKVVRFSTVSIYEHALVLGDNPAVSEGVPLQLDWTATTTQTFSVDEYESLVAACSHAATHSKRVTRLSPYVRQVIARRHASKQTLVVVREQVRAIQRSREASQHWAWWEFPRRPAAFSKLSLRPNWF